jgi:hypothetical protein
LLFLRSFIPAIGFSQGYSIDWFKIAGGGGTSTGAQQVVTGAIGQPDARGAMSGGNYSVTGGYWSVIDMVQTPGAPTLLVRHIHANILNATSRLCTPSFVD